MFLSRYNVHFKFNASHSMGDISKAHAHTFLCGLILSKNGNEYIPFYEYEKTISDYFNKYRGQYLNNCDVFKTTIPTLENMADQFYLDIQEILYNQSDYKLRLLELGDSPVNSVVISNTFVVDDIDYMYSEKRLNNVLKFRKYLKAYSA